MKSYKIPGFEGEFGIVFFDETQTQKSGYYGIWKSRHKLGILTTRHEKEEDAKSELVKEIKAFAFHEVIECVKEMDLQKKKINEIASIGKGFDEKKLDEYLIE